MSSTKPSSMRSGDELLESLKRDPSDQRAWAELYDLLEPRLRGFVYDLAEGSRGNLSDVDDIVHIVLGRLVKNFRQTRTRFTSFEHLRNYVFKACRNELTDEHRRTGRQTSAYQVVRLRFEDLAAEHFMQAFREAENQRLIAQLIGQLNSSCQALISGYLLTQQTLAEYAEARGIKLGTIYSQWHRCINELREILNDRARKKPPGA
jgi:RNA polymerase sigma factor (sigma-70 family)